MAAEAVAAFKSVVDDFLAGAFEPGMSVTDLYGLFTGFGEDPFIMVGDPKAAPAISFSAWVYARERWDELARG